MSDEIEKMTPKQEQLLMALKVRSDPYSRDASIELESAWGKITALKSALEEAGNDIKCYEAMKKGVAIRMGDMGQKLSRLRSENEKLQRVRGAAIKEKRWNCWSPVTNADRREAEKDYENLSLALAATEPKEDKETP